MNCDEFEQLAALRALGALEGPEAEALQARLARNRRRSPSWTVSWRWRRPWPGRQVPCGLPPRSGRRYAKDPRDAAGADAPVLDRG